MSWEPWRRAEIKSGTKTETLVSEWLAEALGRSVKGEDIYGVVLAIATEEGVGVNLLFSPHVDAGSLLPCSRQALLEELDSIESQQGAGGMVN